MGLTTSIIFYIVITSVAVGLVGSPALAKSGSPLATAVAATHLSWTPTLVAVGALIATFSVLLSDNIGLSRMIFAMGRKGDYPRWLGHVDERSRLPRRSIVLTGVLAAISLMILTFVNLVQIASFFILVYFALANLSSIRLKDNRSSTTVLSALGIIGTLGLAFSLTLYTVIIGVLLISFGIVYFFLRRGFDKKLVLKQEI